jgi:protein TonB
MSAADSRHLLQALGLAIVVELALLASAAAILALPATTKPALSEPVPIVLANEEQPAVEPPQPKPEPPHPKPKLLTPPPKAMPPPPPPPEAPKELRQAMPVAAEPSAFTEPLPPPSVPAPTPTERADKAKPSAEYAAKVHAAVQAAHYYPPAAAALRYSGRVRVEFRLRDKIASESRLLVASGFGIIDRAALQAVQSAQYPEPPQELKGAELIYQVWVEFNR